MQDTSVTINSGRPVMPPPERPTPTGNFPGLAQDPGPRYELMWVPVSGPPRILTPNGYMAPALAYPYLPVQMHPSIASAGYNPPQAQSSTSMIHSSQTMQSPHPIYPAQYSHFPHSSFPQPYVYPGSFHGPYVPYGGNQSMSIAEYSSWTSTNMGTQPLVPAGGPSGGLTSASTQSLSWESQQQYPPYNYPGSHGQAPVGYTPESRSLGTSNGQADQTSRNPNEQPRPMSTYQIPDPSQGLSSSSAPVPGQVNIAHASSAENHGNLHTANAARGNHTITAESQDQYRSEGLAGILQGHAESTSKNQHSYNEIQLPVETRTSDTATTDSPILISDSDHVDVVGISDAEHSETDSSSEAEEDDEDFIEQDTVEVTSEPLYPCLESRRSSVNKGMEQVQDQQADSDNESFLDKLEKIQRVFQANTGSAIGLGAFAPDPPRCSPLILRIPIQKSGNEKMKTHQAAASHSSDPSLGSRDSKNKKPDVTTRSGRKVRARVHVKKVSATSVSSEEEVKKVRSKKTVKGRYECATCSQVYCYQSQLKIHEKRHEMKQCNQCDLTFADRKDMMAHQFEKHGGPSPPRINAKPQHKCSVCNQIFASNSECNVHRAIHDADGKYPCALCGVRFWHWQSRRAHFKICYDKVHGPLEKLVVG